jgi:hypothetical protein
MMMHSLYPFLESLIADHKHIKIIYNNNQSLHTIYGAISRAYFDDEESKIILDNGIAIPLNALIEIDGRMVSGIC